jgi:hypothetical protein
MEDRWKLTPGVPQISVNSESLLESITRLRPKSAIMMSASGAFERKRRFSGFKSVVCTLSYQIISKRGDQRTAVDDATIVDVFNGFKDSADECCCIAVQTCIG